MKKLTMIAVALLVLACSPLLLCGSRSMQGFVPVDTIDAKKMLASERTSFAKHAFQPAPDTMRAKRYSGSLDTETTALITVLHKVAHDELILSDADIRAKRMGLTELWDGSDYLLLSYVTKSGLRVDIQDGKLLYMLVTWPKESVKAASDIPAFVLKAAETVFALPPAKLDSDEWPKWSVLPSDIGRSKAGTLSYGSSVDRQGPDWYTTMLWWSDGKRVLFQISKADYEARATQAGPPADLHAPRRFASRTTPPAVK